MRTEPGVTPVRDYTCRWSEIQLLKVRDMIIYG